jgi:hypothetical protein
LVGWASARVSSEEARPKQPTTRAIKDAGRSNLNDLAQFSAVRTLRDGHRMEIRASKRTTGRAYGRPWAGRAPPAVLPVCEIVDFAKQRSVVVIEPALARQVMRSA